jgi:hypothetical protein
MALSRSIEQWRTSARRNVSAWTIAFLRLCGVDRAIAYTILGRGWSLISGPVTVLCVARFLTADEQGFYYTFGSILGLQIFFELGLTFVILQFASHERSRLSFAPDGTLTGDDVAKHRLAALLQTALKWYGIASTLVIVLLLPAGLWFFDKGHTVASVTWRLPWMLVVLISAGALLVSPILAMLEGCGLVAEVALVRTVQGIIGTLCVWLTLWRGWALFAVPLLNAVGLVASVIWLIATKRRLLFDLFRARPDAAPLDWWGEVWPMQWRIAVSWLSGYFILQLFNPVLFAFRGAAEAGRMGMSSNIVAVITAGAIAWVTTKSAPFGTLVARRDWQSLDALFFPSFLQSLTLMVIGSLSFFAAVLYLHRIHHPLSERLLAPLPLALIVLTAILQHIVGAEAIYLRAHKQEPFVVLSVIGALLAAPSTYFLGRKWGAVGMASGFLAIYAVVFFGMGSWIFVTKRREWHTVSSQAVPA